MPTVEIFLEQLSGPDTVSSKIWKQQCWSKVHRRNVHRWNSPFRGQPMFKRDLQSRAAYINF